MRSRTIKTAYAVLLIGGLIWVGAFARILTGIPTRTYRTKPPVGASINWGDPITRGLVGVWNFNENQGLSVNDRAWYGTGTLTNHTGTGAPAWATGPDGPMLNFTAASKQFINIPNNPGFLLAKSHTAATPILWGTFEVAFRVNSNRDFNGIFSKTNSSQPCPFDIYEDHTGTLNMFFGTCGTFAPGSISAAVSPNKWYHLILVLGDEVQGKIIAYLNGAIVASTTWNSGLSVHDNGDPLTIGTRADFVTFLDGSVSYARVWQRSLNYNEVQRLTQNPFCFMASPDQNAFVPSGAASKTVHRVISQ